MLFNPTVPYSSLATKTVSLPQHITPIDIGPAPQPVTVREKRLDITHTYQVSTYLEEFTAAAAAY